MRKIATTGLVLSLAAPLTAHAADDAGDAAFVHQAVQTLLCRKPRGAAEIQELTSVVTLHGREVAVDVIMSEPDFVDCWVPILADAMQIQRAGDFEQAPPCVNNPEYLVDGSGNPCSTCLTEATGLADHIRDLAPRNTLFDPDGDGVGDPWNLNDAIRAAILVDDLHVAWRPWLFALAGRPQILDRTGTSDIRDNYLATAFNVKTECVGCHSSTYSKTEVYSSANYAFNISPSYAENTWDRTVPLSFDLHGGAFSTGATVDTANDPTGLYAAECAGCHGVTGETWPSCGGGRSPLPHKTRVPMLGKGAIVSQILFGGECMPPIDLDGDGLYAEDGDVDELPLAEDLTDFMRAELGGWEEMNRFLDEDQFTDPAAVDGPWGLSSTCGFAWTYDVVTDGATHSFGGDAVTYTDVANITNALKDGLDLMPLQGVGAPVTAPADPYLAPTPDPESSVALLLAANIADDLIEELTGGRETVAHGLSRVADQSLALKAVILSMLVDDGTRITLSLRSAIKAVVLSSAYNRNAPSETTLTASAYELPMLANPWAATSSGVTTLTGDNLNGQGDLVHRRSPDEILRSLHKDLGWRAPPVYPGSGTSFPTRDLMRQIGRYESSKKPGSIAWQFSSLLLWEAGMAVGTTSALDDGPCANPSTTPDYIDKLVNDASVAAPVPTISALTIALKDRLLQEPVIDAASGEEALVGALLDGALGAVGTLPMAANTWSRATVKRGLRQYCGALLVSPDYLLANLPTVTAVPTPPAFQVCLAGELCTAADLASHYCTTLTGMALACPP